MENVFQTTSQWIEMVGQLPLLHRFGQPLASPGPATQPAPATGATDSRQLCRTWTALVGARVRGAWLLSWGILETFNDGNTQWGEHW